MRRMYKTIKNKLNSTRGISILYAMLFFLVASMVSVTIVSAALSSVKSIHENRRYEQNSLALESAVGLLKNELGDTPSVVYEKVTNSSGTVISSRIISNGTEVTNPAAIVADNSYTYELYTLVSTLISQKTSNPTNDPSITFTVQSSKSEIPAGNVTMTLKHELTAAEAADEDIEDNSFELVLCVQLAGQADKMYIMYSGTHQIDTQRYDDIDGNTNTKTVESYIWNNVTVSSYEE